MRIHVRLSWRKFLGSARQGKSKMKKEGRSVVSASATCRSDNERLCTSTRAIYIWLLKSLTCGKLAQDSEDWPASYVATYPSRSLMCVRGYHIVFSYLVIPPKAGNAINMKGYNTL